MKKVSTLSFKPFIACCVFMFIFSACGSDSGSTDGAMLKGIFYDSPIKGVSYSSKSTSGITDANGEFAYSSGETITFELGGLTLGSCTGQEKITPAHLIPEVGGDISKITHQKATNMARFLQSLDADDNIENGIDISSETRGLISRLSQIHGVIDFDQSEEAFSEAPTVVALFENLIKTVRTGPQARNHLRRSLRGIKKFTDVQIPMRDGSYLLADIYLPVDEGKYPTILSSGVYGKSFINGCICDYEQMLTKEFLEDSYFEGNPFDIPFENHETLNTAQWIPEGYVAVKIDSRGVCNTPGNLDVLSVQEAEDFYDAIEWAAKQPWSSGNIGLWGASYLAITQWNVASLQPPSLKAMIPIAGDVDLYRDIALNGGILNEDFLIFWGGQTYDVTCATRDFKDIFELANANPFYDSEKFGFMGTIATGADLENVTVPLLSEIPLTHTGHIHIRGSAEGYIHAASEQKRMSLVSGDFIHWSYTPEAHADHKRFFDYYLKGIDNGLLEDAPVKMMVRTGNGSYFWQYENEFPVSRTEYSLYYLDGSSSSWKGDGLRSDFMHLSSTAPIEETVATYSSEVDTLNDPCWASGVSFVTEPMTEDVLIGGFIKLVLWVSSTVYDMDIHASIRVINENNHEVSYTTHPEDPSNHPVGLGWLKVSHRVEDPDRSTVYRPYHTHLESDYAPLSSNNEIVKAEVELWPTTALIKAGYRIRLDVQPYDGCGQDFKHQYDSSYHDGANNSIYTGPDHMSYLQLPVIPAINN